MPVLRASPRLRESPLTLRVFVASIAVSICHPLGYIVVIEFEVELVLFRQKFTVTVDAAAAATTAIVSAAAVAAFVAVASQASATFPSCSGHWLLGMIDCLDSCRFMAEVLVIVVICPVEQPRPPDERGRLVEQPISVDLVTKPRWYDVFQR